MSERLAALPHQGLSDIEAATRLSSQGPNVSPTAKRTALGMSLLRVLKEPMFALLLACSIFHFVLGDLAEAA